MLPIGLYKAVVRSRLPRATFKILPDVAHVPTLDDPELVARTILDVTGAAKAYAEISDGHVVEFPSCKPAGNIAPRAFGATVARAEVDKSLDRRRPVYYIKADTLASCRRNE